jgi:hypothetical protein
MRGDGFRPNDFRRRANAVRSIPLADVLAKWGADRDRLDRNRWHTERGPISITDRGTGEGEGKFFNWHLQQGGGGAIDLAMHLGDCNARVAVRWLEQHRGDPGRTTPLIGSSLFSPAELARGRSSPISSRSFSDNTNVKVRSLCLPVASSGNLARVRRYLTELRRLCPSIIRWLITSGKLYADRRGNAVFLMVAGKAQRPMGAELRGTGQRVWRGLAPGTRKDAGYFWIGEPGNSTSRWKTIVLCESAIDAISCYQLDRSRICLSTAGARPDARWLARLLSASYDIHCGFDDDEAGNTASRQMIRRHPSIRRLRPPAHDWNDALAAHRSVAD